MLWLCEQFDEECIAQVRAALNSRAVSRSELQVLLLLRNVGSQLRRDDPGALKTLIELIKANAAKE